MNWTAPVEASLAVVACALLLAFSLGLVFGLALASALCRWMHRGWPKPTGEFPPPAVGQVRPIRRSEA